MTESSVVRERQRDLIQAEIGSIVDIEELKVMEMARMGQRDAISDAASCRRSQLEDTDRGTIRSSVSSQALADGQSFQQGQSSADDEIASPEEEPSDPEWELIGQPDPSRNSTLDADQVSYQTLYSVICDGKHLATYFDAPTFGSQGKTSDQWDVLDKDEPFRNPSSLHLSGKRLVPDVSSYLRQNEHLGFVVFQEYRCIHDSRATRTPKPTYPYVRLISKSLCQELNRLIIPCEPWEIRFEPDMHIWYPHHRFYYHREFLEGQLNDCLDESRPRPSKQARSLLGYISKSMTPIYKSVEHAQCLNRVPYLNEGKLLFVSRRITQLLLLHVTHY
jgi:hypothetical protein